MTQAIYEPMSFLKQNLSDLWLEPICNASYKRPMLQIQRQKHIDSVSFWFQMMVGKINSFIIGTYLYLWANQNDNVNWADIFCSPVESLKNSYKSEHYLCEIFDTMWAQHILVENVDIVDGKVYTIFYTLKTIINSDNAGFYPNWPYRGNCFYLPLYSFYFIL